MTYPMLIYENEKKQTSFPAQARPEAIAKQDPFTKKYQALRKALIRTAPRPSGLRRS